MSKTQAIDNMSYVLNSILSEKIYDPAPDEFFHGFNCIYILGPTSFLGGEFAKVVTQQLLALKKVVVFVDDYAAHGIYGPSECQVISTNEFLQGRFSNAMAINMANSVFAYCYFKELAKRSGNHCVDIISVLSCFDLPVIYQSAKKMRKDTLERLDDYIELAAQFDDELSIETLCAFLKLRLTLDRSALLPVLCSLEDEYFSSFPLNKRVTFELGKGEIFCDIGAHTGSTVRKFMTATQFEYSEIHAFEPDRSNFSILNENFSNSPNVFLKNIALSAEKGLSPFSETGTMGSRLNGSGSVMIEASTLDSELENVTFIKIDVEGHEAQILRGARRLITQCKPRMAVTVYHFANDLLDIAALLKEMIPEYRLRLRQHSLYYYDTIIYADVPR